MSIWMRLSAVLMLLAGLAISSVGSATCSVSTASNELQRDATDSNEAGLSTTTESADAAPSRAPAAARGTAAPAPRARWHRYLPGMFK